MIVIVMIVLLSNQQEKCSKVVCRGWLTLKWSSLLAKLIWLTVPRGGGGGFVRSPQEKYEKKNIAATKLKCGRGL